MIDWIKSAELNNTTIDELKAWFEKYPSSNKEVVRICDNCPNVSKVMFKQCTDLCKKCSHNTPEYILVRVLKQTQYYIDHPEAVEAARLKSLEQWSHQENCDEASRIKKQWFIDHPEAGNEHSEILKNSEAAKIAADNQRGGFDLVWHHVAYDFNDPDALRVRITRKFHGAIHHPPGISIAIRGYSLID